jgi:cholest-4-en-3-one 26-monooxygenase
VEGDGGGGGCRDDLVDPDVYQRGGARHEQFSWLREHAPVFWLAAGGAAGWSGFWAVTRQQEVVHLSRQAEDFSSAHCTVWFLEYPDR